MENQSPERTVTSPARATTANIPPPISIPESVTDPEKEGTSAPNRDSTWPRPLKELEKEKAKTPAEPSPKPDPRPTPKAQALLNQEQQKKKKQQQQTLEKQQKRQPEVVKPPQQAQQQTRQPEPAKTPGASPPPNPTRAASGATPTTSDKRVVAGKQVSATPSVIRFGQALSKPRTPSGDKLDSAEAFVDAWNGADLAEGYDPASPHPAGPSRMFQSLHCVQASVEKANRVFEVNLPNPAFISS